MQQDHDDWLLVQQDCDLAWHAVAGTNSLLELRPVFQGDPPDSWGIRNRKLRLDWPGAWLDAEAPAIRVTPDVVFAADHLTCPTDEAARLLKRWLGLRYDRPAIPERFVTLARELAKRLAKPSQRVAVNPLLDILATFREDPDGRTGYRLIAVVPWEDVDADPELLARTRESLAGVALGVPDRLGYALDIDAYRDDQVSLAFLQTSFSLDLTTISWPNAAPGPSGTVAP